MAKLDAAGNCVWHHAYGPQDVYLNYPVTIRAVATDSAGHVLWRRP